MTSEWPSARPGFKLTEERQTVPYVWVHPTRRGKGRRFAVGLFGFKTGHS
jgi:hypothetical protein